MSITSPNIYYSESFFSSQGEALYTGVPTAWLRLFACNLNCDGFFQKDPTDPTSYELPYKDFDPKTVNRLEDLPVWSKGCDSSYSWSKKYKHLTYQKSPKEVALEIMGRITNKYNPNGSFIHETSKQHIHMCFTGGEPLLPVNQRAVCNVLKAFEELGNLPKFITFETNGTQLLTQETKDCLDSLIWNRGGEVTFSVSPKLFTVSGEKATKAIRPDVLAQYNNYTHTGYLKFVVGTEQRQWDELDEVIKKFRDAGCIYDVWIMPLGSLEEQQQATAGEIANMALERGYNVAARVHCYLWGNKIGV